MSSKKIDDAPPSYHALFPSSSYSSASSNAILSRDLDSDLDDHSDQETEPARYRSVPLSNNDGVLEHALEFTQHSVPQIIDRRPLERPIAIPQIGAKSGMPFARAYSPDLANHGVVKEEFVEFVDNLNIVLASNPVIGVLDLAGGAIGMVPYHHAKAISGVIQATAKIGKIAITKIRGSRYLEQANRDFFHPRGLTVEIVTGEVLKMKLGLNLESSLPMMADQRESLRMHERRVAGIQGYVAPITFDVPPPNRATNMLDQLTAAQQSRILKAQESKFLERQSKDTGQGITPESSEKADKRSKEITKIEKDMQREQEKYDKEIAKIDVKYEREMRRKPKDAHKIERDRQRDLNRADRRIGKEVRELEKDLNKASSHEGRSSKKSRKSVKEEEKELKASQKVLWILVETYENR